MILILIYESRQRRSASPPCFALAAAACSAQASFRLSRDEPASSQEYRAILKETGRESPYFINKD